MMLAIRSVIARYLTPHVHPWFLSSDIRIVGTRMEAGGSSYAWFVNAHDRDEYLFSRSRFGAGVPGAGTDAKIAELVRWEESEIEKGKYSSTLRFERMPGVPYDLVSSRPMAITKNVEGSEAITVSMERFGGVLVAWMPGEIGSLGLSVARKFGACAKLTVKAEIRGGRQKTATRVVVGVSFVLRDPSGKEHLASGVRATKEGVAEWSWTPAMNDPIGSWTLEATELASGKKSTASIDIYARVSCGHNALR
jgi:hypothetical protein